MKDCKLTRRSLVKSAVAIGAAAALGGSAISRMLTDADKAWADSPTERTMVKSLCHGCIAACPCRVYLENGVVVKIEGDPDAPISKGSFCLKGLNQMHTVYSPRRILHPLKLVGGRGSNEWEQISWDDAIELAATKIKTSIDKYGPTSFFTAVGGGGSYSFMVSLSFSLYLGSPTAFEPGCAQCWLPRQAMSMYCYGMIALSMADGAVNEPWNFAAGNTKALVLWGAQPSVSQVSQSGRGMADLRAAGCKTVVVDPNFSPDAAKATVWLPVRPATDGALLLCWLRYIIDNELYDEHFAKYWTNYPFLINPETNLPWEAQEVWPDYVSATPENTPVYVCLDKRTGTVQPLPFSLPEDSPVDPELLVSDVEVNGLQSKTALQIYWEEAEQWTLEKTAETCWLLPERIEEAIRLYATGELPVRKQDPSWDVDPATWTCGIVNGVASDQMEIASQVPLGCLGLDMLMGFVNKPGAAITRTGAFSRGMSRPTMALNGTGGNGPMANGIGWVIGQSETENRERFESFPDKRRQEDYHQLLLNRLGCNEHKGLYNWSMVHIPTVLEAIKTGEPFRPRVWYDFSGNKLSALANATAWYEVFPQIDFIINQYPNLTSFQVEACDLVLPMVEWLEFAESNFMTAQINTSWMRADVIHLGETVENGVAPVRILKRIGELQGGVEYPLLEDGAESHEAIHSGIAAAFNAESWDDLVANQDSYVPLVTPPESYWIYNQHEWPVNDGLPQGFGTMSRKCEPYAQILVRMSRTGFPYLWPYETLPSEAEYSPICRHIEPAESPLEGHANYNPDYPLVLTSGRVYHYHHGTMRHSAFARELYPVPDVRINPQTADKYGLKHMDWVEITSRRSSTHGRVYVTKGVAPNVLWMERFWNPECFDETQKEKTGGWRECNVNVLTKNSAPFNEVFGSYTNRGFCVQIKKSQKPGNIWVEPQEFGPFLPTLQSDPQQEPWVF